MKNSRTIRIILGVMLTTFIFLSIVGYSYAYFSLEIDAKPKEITMSTGDLRLIYKDDTELKLVDAMPGDSVSKEITVNNVGTKSVTYSLYWENLINTIDNFELHVTLECKSYLNYGKSNQTESGTCDRIYRAVPISNTVTTGNIKGNISIDPNITHEYIVTVKFDNKTYPQDDNLNKTFSGKIGIKEYTTAEIVKCLFDGEVVQGAEYVNGDYTYRYNLQGVPSSNNNLIWGSILTEGWGVQLTDKASTSPVTSKVCTYINDKPVVSMSYMFYNSQAISIDLNSFNTSKVTNMGGMFENTASTTLDLSSFDTSNVVTMYDMFSNCAATSLDLSSFDTSKVTNMTGMFYGNKATTLDLSNFNTENVNNMSYMFSNSVVSTLDLSSFHTSNVTNMNNMFENCYNLTTIYVSDKFTVNKVTSSNSMFQRDTKLVGGAGTVYNSSYADKTYARVDGGTSLPGYFTLKN